MTSQLSSKRTSCYILILEYDSLYPTSHVIYDKGVRAKMSLSLNIWPLLGEESLELGPGVKEFKE